MKEEVKEVKLLKPFNVDNITIKKNSHFHNAYWIDLPMDSVPDHIWQDNFEQVWKTSENLWDWKLYIVGDKLRIVTTIDSFDKKLDWIEQVVNETNKKIEEYNRLIQAEEKHTAEMAKQTLEEDRIRAERIKESLRQRFA